jgi:tetratricopeptide (TPR) repeat protein/S1-C subfamily serine protease
MSNPSIAWASLLVLLSTCMPAMAISPAHSKPAGIGEMAQTTPEETLEQIAQRATVRIVTGQNKGSGTIISKRDNTYLILTNSHVVKGAQSIQVQTFDTQTYSAKVVPNAFAKEQDLALLEITSSKSYSVPEIASFSPQLESETLSAGYGASSGKFQTSEGKVQQLPTQALKEGYQLGYSGEVVQGMSGGPVFDAADYKLIGINGRTAFPVVASYVYEDGSKPSAAEVQQMRQVNWSIPIRSVLAQVQPNILTDYKLPLPESDPGVKTTKLAGWLGEIEAKAKQFTVRIDDNCGGNGSGVIVAKQGKTYTVLTAEHVVKDNISLECKKESYKTVTYDGKTYGLNKTRFRTEEGVDLAVVEFESDAVYPIATLANYNTKQSDYVFVAGFPKIGNTKARWMFSGGKIYEKELGRFQIRDTRIANSSGSGVAMAQSLASFAGAYEMVYTSITYGGMSGGAVLDSQGRVIGIHGLAEGESEIAGESKTEKITIQLGNSLGIPIRTFMGLVPRFKLSAQQLSLTSAKPNAVSTLQNSDISNAILKVGVPKDNAKPSIWIERGNQLLRLERYPEAEAAFDRAIQLTPTFVHLAFYGKGKALVGQHKKPEAIQALEAAQLKQPSYTPALSYLGTIHRWLNQNEKALIVINKAIQLESKNANLYNEKSLVLTGVKRYSEALSAIEQAIELSPRAAFYNNRGATYSNLKKYPKAIADYDKAIAINPEYAEAYVNRGNTYNALKDYPKAITDLDKAIVINPELTEAYGNRGNTYNALKDYPRAIADYTKAIAINPELTEVYYNRGLTYVTLQDYPKATTDFDKAIAINPEYAEAYGNRGNTYNVLQDYPRAIADYTKAIAINPKYADSYYNRGLTYVTLQDYPKAIADFDKAIAINPEDANAYYKRGLTYAALKDYPKAITDLDKAIAINPESTEAYYYRGLTYAALKDYPKAIADYDKAIAINPEYAEAYIIRGATYAALQDYPKAIADYTKAIAINPEYADPYYNRGLTYVTLQDYPKAIADFDKAIAINPEYADAYYSRGITYYALKDYPKAIADHDRAIAINPELAEAYANRGLSYAESGNTQQAKKDLQTAAQLFHQQERMDDYEQVMQIFQQL